MCGIAGFYTKSDLDRGATIGSMLDVMAYRGPDDRNTADIDQVTFGHLRLSIIDLANGKQPMVSPDGRYTLIFNGEIYNYVELKQELVGKGHAISTSSDTEVLLHMYMEYGAEMLDQLNGMFALAIYDKQDKELFVARDHFGVKPFYFHQSEGVFVFASEIKSLLQFLVFAR